MANFRDWSYQDAVNYISPLSKLEYARKVNGEPNLAHKILTLFLERIGKDPIPPPLVMKALYLPYVPDPIRQLAETLIREILKIGVDINEYKCEGTALLHYAAANGTFETLSDLIKKGATIDKKDSEGITPLHLAASKGRTNVVLALLEKGANIHEKDTYGQTPLIWAASKGKTETTLALIGKGAKVDARDNKERTALHWASAYGYNETLLELIKHNAQMDVQNYTGESPLHYAAARGQKVTLCTLIEKGAHINIKDTKERTPLYWACINQNEQAALDLIKNGASIFVLDYKGKTPLSYCPRLKLQLPPLMRELSSLIPLIEHKRDFDIETWDIRPDLVQFAFTVPGLASFLLKSGADSIQTSKVFNGKLPQVGRLDELSLEDFRAVIPHFWPEEWLKHYRDVILKSKLLAKEMLSLSLPSQLQAIGVVDLIVVEYKEIESCTNLGQVQMKQKRLDALIAQALKKPEQRLAIKDKEDLKNQMLLEIHERIKREHSEVTIPPDFLDPVSRELLDPRDCWCDPTMGNKKVCNKASFQGGRSPYTGLPVSENTLIPAPQPFVDQLKKLHEVKNQGVESLRKYLESMELTHD